MKTELTRRSAPGAALLIAAVMALVAVGERGHTEENVGTVRQPLVGGQIVSEATQEEFGLLSFGNNAGSCSASLLRNDWAITAAHCVESQDTMGRKTPDPARPGQFMLRPLSSYFLTANWGGGQTRKCVRVETFQPYDVALLQTATPFKVHGSTSGYSRLVFQDGQFPYFGNPVGAGLLIFGRGINQFASGSYASARPSRSDGLYRFGYARANRSADNYYWYPSEGGQMIAGGDSGGPSFAWVLGGYALVGVHSRAQASYAPGHEFKPGDDPWQWVTSTPEAADAPIAPVWPQILAIIGPANAPETPPPPQFIGDFGKSDPNYHPIFLYGITRDGALLWYRKDTGTAPWQGPAEVGEDWDTFKTVIPAGGDCVYALTEDGRLLWYEHDGFNTGTHKWSGPVEVSHDWKYNRIFSGSDGIIYAVRDDGALLWFRHRGYANGSPTGWEGPRVVGSGWGDFKLLCSGGKGVIYAVNADGELLRYQHDGYKTGDATWQPARTIGTNWQIFRQIIPAGDGILLAIRNDGELIRYDDLGPKPATGLAAKLGGATVIRPSRRPVLRAPVAKAPVTKTPAKPNSGLSSRYKNSTVVGKTRIPSQAGTAVLQQARLSQNEQWKGPFDIGTGWQNFDRIVSLLPVTTPPVIH